MQTLTRNHLKQMNICWTDRNELWLRGHFIKEALKQTTERENSSTVGITKLNGLNTVWQKYEKYEGNPGMILNASL